MTNSAPPVSHTIADIQALIRRESRRVTSYDVASLAGVSQSAVSRCFKPGASVSKPTFARVMKAARDLDYTPNAAARSLITRRSNLIAVVASTMLTLHFPDVLAELSRQFASRGMRILLFTMPREGDVDQTLSEVWQHQVDGAVVAAGLSAQQIAEFERRQVPFVLFNRHLRDQTVNAIVCDQIEAARMLVARLVGAGHRRFAMIDGPAGSVMAQDRQRGVDERLAELGIAPPLHVPGALSITGFDGIVPSAWLSYNLTTLRQPVQTMAQSATDMLAGLIASGSTCPERRLFSATLIEGATARLGPPV
jgi:DNA-binding LacI/PurR family transcriptional regulator